MPKWLRINWFLLVLFGALPIGWASESRDAALESRIARVTVYSDRAEVTRSAEARLKNGRNTLSIVDLPAVLLDDSVQVKINGAARLTGVEVKPTFPTESVNERIKALEAQIKTLQNEDRVLADKEDLLQSQQSFLDSLKAGAADKISGEFLVQVPDPREIKPIMTFIFEEKQAAATKIHAINLEREDLQAKISALRKELQQISHSRSKTAKSILVTLLADKPTSVSLTCRYLVRGAVWKPSYQARLMSSKGEIELSLIGEVRQKTGEDWDRVALILSTAKPSRGARAPELRPWYLKFRPLPRPTDAARQETLALEKRLPEEPMVSAEPPPTAGVEIGETTVRFAVPDQVRVPSDWSFHKTTLARHELPADLSYITIPKLDNKAYLRASLVNQAPYPFLAGDVDIFIGTQYVGKNRIKTIPPEQSFDLDLGTDANLDVKRELLKKYEQEAGLLNKERKIQYVYQITLQNFKTSPCEAALMDQIPVSQNEQIEVSADILQPQPTEQTDSGLLTWKMKLQPREKKEIRLGFTVQFPKDKEVNMFE
jgi:uncharacterized protein (TIGR02231 family)